MPARHHGVVVDEHADLRHPLGAGPARGRSDHGVDVQLGPRGAGVAVDPTQAADLGIDGAVQGGVTDRIEFQMGVMHPGGLVDPPLHTGSCPLRLQLGDVATWSGGHEIAGQLPALPLEGVDARVGGGLQQQVLVGEELVAKFLVQSAGRVGERIEMTARDRTVGQRVLEVARGSAHPITLGHGGSVLAGSSPGGAEQRLRWRCPTGGSQLTTAASAAHLERIQPTSYCAGCSDHCRQLTPVEAARISDEQCLNSGSQPVGVHHVQPPHQRADKEGSRSAHHAHGGVTEFRQRSGPAARTSVGGVAGAGGGGDEAGPDVPADGHEDHEDHGVLRPLEDRLDLVPLRAQPVSSADQCTVPDQ